MVPLMTIKRLRRQYHLLRGLEEVVVIRRLGLAVLVAGLALAGFATGTAAAASDCADYHWIGAAGSGQRDAAGLTTNGGMGGVVYQSFLQMRDELAASGLTMTAEAVQYPAAPVPLEGGLGGWMTFMDSVKAGTAATAKQFKAFTKQCPASKVVLAGYSQGAMVVHRNLHDLGDDPHVAAALLIADGDRLPVDTTIDMGTTALVSSTVPSVGKGVAQGPFVPGVGSYVGAATRDRRPYRERLRRPRSGLRLRPRHDPNCRRRSLRSTPRTRPPRAVRTPGAHRSTSW